MPPVPTHERLETASIQFYLGILTMLRSKSIAPTYVPMEKVQSLTIKDFGCIPLRTCVVCNFQSIGGILLTHTEKGRQ